MDEPLGALDKQLREQMQLVPERCGRVSGKQISPTILAVATLLVVISAALITTLEFLRRRNERIRGMTPG